MQNFFSARAGETAGVESDLEDHLCREWVRIAPNANDTAATTATTRYGNGSLLTMAVVPRTVLVTVLVVRGTNEVGAELELELALVVTVLVAAAVSSVVL